MVALLFKSPPCPKKSPTSPDCGDVPTASRERLAAIKRKESRRAAFQNYRQMDNLFDFICEFCGKEENLIVNPGEKYVDAEVSGSFISPEWKKYTVKRPQGKRESDASYRKYLAKREAALAHAEGMHLDEIARAYVDRFGGDEAEIEQKMGSSTVYGTNKQKNGIFSETGLKGSATFF